MQPLNRFAAALLVFGSLCIFSGQAAGQAVKAVVPGRLTIEIEGQQVQLPYMSSIPIDKANPQVDRAVIVIHGIGRDADVYLASITQAAALTANGSARTLMAAPQFLNHEDLPAHQLADAVPTWNGSAWADGSDSRPIPGAANKKISSFTAADRLIEQLAEQTVFPRLKTVVVVGHSAGGQFVNRYAAGSQVHEKLEKRGLRIRYIVANPSSYLYFNDERPVPGSAGRFSVPAAEQIAKCKTFNDYRYGLNRLNSYMQVSGPDKLRSQYAQREVIYLLGGEDKDPQHASLSKHCAAEMQGAHRLQRGQFYHAYLRHYFGTEIARHHRLQLVPGVAHNSRLMFNSPAGVRCIFDAPAARAR